LLEYNTSVNCNILKTAYIFSGADISASPAYAQTIPS